MREKGITNIKGKPLDEVATIYKNDETPMLETYSNVERKSIIVPNSNNNLYDIHRDYDGAESPLLAREGLDKEESLRWTDEVMYGWKKAASFAQKDVKDLELESVIRYGIVTKDSINVINAVMARVGKQLDGVDDVFKVNKYDPDPKMREGFEAIAGTIHGNRVAQMLREYVSP